MSVTWTPQIVAAVLAFVGMLIFVHELGHFLAAKLFDIKVVRFSLGFGPPLVRFVKGETTYQIALIPLGGYVKMVGQDPHEEIEPEDEARAFSTAPVHQRAIVAIAGPAFNLLFPILCFFAFNLLEPIQQSAVVGTVEIGKPAQRAGFEPGDEIREVDGDRVWSFERMTDLIRSRPGQPTEVLVERDGEDVRLEVTPASVRARDEFGGEQEFGQIGITSLLPSSRIGVFDRARSPGDFKTGDRLVSIGGASVDVAYEVDRELRRQAGRTVEVVLARPVALRAGDLLAASPERPVTQTVRIPEGIQTMAEIGWATSGSFLRSVVPGGPAEAAGLRPGDQLVGVEGKDIRLFWSFVQAVENSEGQPLAVSVIRDGARLELTLEPRAVSCINDFTQKPYTLYDHGLGISYGDVEEPMCRATVARAMTTRSHWMASLPPKMVPVRLSIGEAFLLSLEQTWGATVKVGAIVYKFFTAEVSYKNLGGPLTFFQVAAIAAEKGVFVYLTWLAVLSINLAFLNLLPIPILDGGHLLFCLIEAVKRKPVSLRVREVAMMVGMVFLLALFVVAFSNDLANWGVF